MISHLLLWFYKLFIFLACLAATLATGFIADSQYEQYQKSVEILSWKKISGAVVSSEIEYHKKRGRRGLSGWCAVVEYAYSQGGSSYISRSFSNNNECSPYKGYATGIMKKYPKGASIDVYLNPYNYQESVVTRENPYGFKARYLFSIVLAIPTLIIWYVFLAKVVPQKSIWEK